MDDFSLVPNPQVKAILRQLLAGARAVLGSHFLGMALDGSLASGGFDQDSDIDFVVVTDEAVRGELFEVLAALHERLSGADSPYAVQLEGTYISREALRRYDPRQALHPNIERGQGERLKMVEQDQAWDLHRYLLREHGIRLAGPDLKTLIDPVSPARLRQAMVQSIPPWLRQILAEPARIKFSGYQSYIVLTLCRVLYTFQTGKVASKPAAAGWAREALDPRWTPLIERAWTGRHHPSLEAPPEEVGETLAMIRFALAILQSPQQND